MTSPQISSSSAGSGAAAGASSTSSSASSIASGSKVGAGLSPVLGPKDSKDKERDSASRMSKMRAALHIGSVVDDWPMYSANGNDYIIGDVIGFGASSIVYQGVFKPLDKACAIKVIDLEAYGRDTEELRRETQLMSLSKHPNVLRVRGCWVEGSKLHIATRLMSSGSMLDIMRFSHPDGFDETIIASALKQALEGLNYLHVNGWLHRDLKAANMLVDEDGTVLLGDFGVGVFVGEREKSTNALSNEGKRKSFVGTPCWMAPEVIERKNYGTKADIWSFGITTLELAQGHAPNSRLAPVKVLMRTMQDEPPKLDRTGGAHKYSKTMEDFVRVCLQKDPNKRPSADKLLGHAFFKNAKPPRHLITAMLAGLPPLAERQERRRAASIASLRDHMSWDFGSISSRGATPSAEKGDPFRNFSGIVSLPSPHGSVRSTKLVSIDGQHVMATEDDGMPFRREDINKSWGSKRRTRSTDGLGHRKSVSFDEPKGAGTGTDGGAGVAAHTALAPIGEKATPQTGPVASGENGDVPALSIAELPPTPPAAAAAAAAAAPTRAFGNGEAKGGLNMLQRVMSGRGGGGGGAAGENASANGSGKRESRLGLGKLFRPAR